MLINGWGGGADSLSAEHIHFHLEELNNLPHRIHSINLSIVNNNGPELRLCEESREGFETRNQSWCFLVLVFGLRLNNLKAVGFKK